MENRAPHKHVRSCVGCGKKAQKTELFRIVRSEEGVLFDPTGRRAGRGAYVCSLACLEKAQKDKKLERALRGAVTQDEVGILGSEIARAVSMAE